MKPALTRDECFAPLLGMLPPEVVRSLGPWIDQLAAAIGPLRARARTGSGAPDGFDGLSRRGPYERLVLTEWAIADVAPEEFLRRAAQHEHPFYQLARRDEARARTSVALFDPGPLQLGGPRVGHFALLLALAGRARQAGARFGWSPLQRAPDAADPNAGLRLGLTEDGLRGFLLGRLATSPAERDLQPWLDLARRDDWEDLWIIGPPDTVAPGRRLPGVKTPVGRIAVSDVFEAGTRALDVTVARGAHRRTLRLPLPPENECLRLVRDGALKPKLPTPVRMNRTPGVARPVSAPVLLADGRKVAFVDADGCVTVYTVPDAPSPKRGRYRRFAVEAGHTVLGLGWTRRQLVLLTEKDAVLHLLDVSGTVFPPHLSRRESLSGPWTPELRPTRLCRVELSTGGAALFIDASDRLMVLNERNALAWYDGARAMATINGRTRVLVAPDAVAHVNNAIGDVVFTPIEGVEGWVAASISVKVVTLQRLATGEWHVPQFGGSAQLIRPPDGAEVLGVTEVSGPSLGLLCLDADRRAVSAISAGGITTLFTLAHAASHAVCSPRGDRVAFILDDGIVEVWSPYTRDCLLHVAAPT